MWILVAKTLHFIGLISWFAGLFYLPRLFVYHREAMDNPNETERLILSKQFAEMEHKLHKIIMTPAMVITFIAGISMIVLYGWEWWKLSIWLHWKLLFVLVLAGYHDYCKKIMLRLAAGERVWDSTKFRMFNEFPTLLLLIIVLLAVFKSSLNWILAGLGVLVFTILLFMAIRWYKKSREKAKLGK